MALRRSASDETLAAVPPTSGRTPSTSARPPASEISAVSVGLKLPPFWPADPHIWFAQVEAQFACRRITSQRSKFDHVVASLSPEFAAEVRDLLLHPPADDPYSVLKDQLTKRTSVSEQRRLQQLLTGEDLGDRKPTQLLRRMEQLLGDRPGIDTSLLRQLFLQKLPPNVRMVLASTTDGTSLSNLAEMADKMVEVAGPFVAPVSVPRPGSPPPAPPAEVEQLRTQVSRLGKLVQDLAHSRSRSSSKQLRRSRYRSPTPTPSPNTPPGSLCWYHSKFGDRAQRCQSPCTWSSNGRAGR